MSAAIAAALTTACKPPPQERYTPDAKAEKRGLALINEVGCGSCHEIPGVDWPKGRIAPSLESFNDVGLIAGALPNNQENLAAFVRNAPAVKEGSTMPPMPLTLDQARDVAAYLYGVNND